MDNDRCAHNSIFGEFVDPRRKVCESAQHINSSEVNEWSTDLENGNEEIITSLLLMLLPNIKRLVSIQESLNGIRAERPVLLRR